MTTYSLGDRVLVGGKVAIVDTIRGSWLRVEFEDDLGQPDATTSRVHKSQVRPAPRTPPRVAPIIPPKPVWTARETNDPAALLGAGIVEVTSINHETRTVTMDLVPSLRAVPKPPKRYENADYLKYVRETHACCCCGERPSARNPMVAHHHGPRGMSAKCDDTRAVPLLDKCHRYFHDHGVFRGTVAFGKWTREQTDECARYTQAALLVRYCKQQGIDTDNVIIEALTAALRKED